MCKPQGLSQDAHASLVLTFKPGVLIKEIQEARKIIGNVSIYKTLVSPKLNENFL